MGRKQDSEKGGHNWREWLRYGFYSAAFLLTLAGALFLFARVDQYLSTNPKFALRVPAAGGQAPQVRIKGAAHVPSAKIINVFAADFGRSIYLLPLAERRQALLQIGWVLDASVSRLWPDRIEVDIVERKPVGFIQLPAAGSPELNSVALIDAEGVILDPPERGDFKLPAFTGIRREQSQPMRRTRVAAALRLVSDAGVQADQFSEIDVGDPDNVKAVMQANGRVVTLQFGNRNFQGRLQNFLTNFEEIERRLPNAAAFDLRLDDRITALGEEKQGG